MSTAGTPPTRRAVLAWLAHGVWVKTDQMIVEGISRITPADFQNAATLGFGIKLLAVITRDFAHNELSVRVHPTLLPEGNVIANVSGVFNAISVTGDVVGTTLYSGRGAGQDATASAVISDIADASPAEAWQGALAPARRGHHGAAQRLPARAAGEHSGRYYLRLTVKDGPGCWRASPRHGETAGQHRERDPESARNGRMRRRSSSRPTKATSAIGDAEATRRRAATALLRIGDFDLSVQLR